MTKKPSRKVKRDALLENEKSFVYQLIMGFDEGRLRQTLIEMLRMYDFSYKMPWVQWRNWIFYMQEAEDVNIITKQWKEPNV